LCGALIPVVLVVGAATAWGMWLSEPLTVGEYVVIGAKCDAERIGLRRSVAGSSTESEEPGEHYLVKGPQVNRVVKRIAGIGPLRLCRAPDVAPGTDYRLVRSDLSPAPVRGGGSGR
jgi:hypothetical protein